MRVLSTLALAALVLLAGARRPEAADATVATYHAGPGRSGHYVVPGLTWAAAETAHRVRSFDGRVEGHIYAQPLYWKPAGAARGMVIVATEANVVRAMDAETGAPVWTRTLGRIVPRSDLPCGNISPLGVTGTPVIDAAHGALYLDAFVTRRGGARHLVFGLSLADGSVLPGWPVDVADGLRRHGMSFTPTIQNQRGALALIRGRLYVPFGGNTGDCEAYHGWVVGLDVAHPRVIAAWATRAEKGGIWSLGALAFDGTSLFTATGNTYGASEWGDGEAILRLPFDLSHSSDPHDYFTPSDWQRLDAEDADIGGTGPLPLDLPLSGGGVQKLLLALGKDGDAYLLDRANLGGIGGQLLFQHVVDGPIISAGALYSVAGGAMVAVHGNAASCPGSPGGSTLLALLISPGTRPGLRTVWCASFAGAGVPVVTTSDGRANPVVWVAGGEGDERLHGFRGDTGAVLFNGGGSGDGMAEVRHLNTILVAGGRLYVPGDGRIFAFAFTPALR